MYSSYFSLSKCPTCGTEDQLHELDCEYEHVELERFEKPYTDLLVVLSNHVAEARKHGTDLHLTRQQLRDRVEDLHYQNPWLREHGDCLDRLIEERRVSRDPNGLRLLEPDERADQIVPTFDPIQAIYETGPVDGCKDYAVYTMVSWCNLKDLTWEQTCNFVTEWLEETGAWERESWGEGSIDALLADKHHVWRNDLGWGEMATVACQKIKDSDVEPGIDAYDKLGADPSDYE